MDKVWDLLALLAVNLLLHDDLGQVRQAELLSYPHQQLGVEMRRDRQFSVPWVGNFTYTLSSADELESG